jgi:hypothetical protein
MNENQVIIGLFVVGLILYLYWKYLFSPTGWFADRRSAYLQLLEKTSEMENFWIYVFKKFS